MQKKRRGSRDPLKKAILYSDILLFEATGGTMGTPLADDARAKEGMTFAEKRGLLDSLVKIAGLNSKLNPDDEESVFDTIKRNKNVGEISGSATDNRTTGSDFDF